MPSIAFQDEPSSTARDMSIEGPKPHVPTRCHALLPRVVLVYLSVKHSHWLAVAEIIQKELRFKSPLKDLNEHWRRAKEEAHCLVARIENCLHDEKVGESRRWAHRLCIVDRAERCAHAAIQYARLQGRTECKPFRMLMFVFHKSTMFHINGMIAHKDRNDQLQSLWLEACQMIECPEFAAKSYDTLSTDCDFSSSCNSPTDDVSGKIKRCVDRSVRSGKPFKKALRYSKVAWAYDTLSQLHRQIHTRIVRIPKDPAIFGNNAFYEERSYIGSDYDRKAHRAREIANLYCEAGKMLYRAEVDYMDCVRPLARRAGYIMRLAAEARVAAFPTSSGAALSSPLYDSASCLHEIAGILQEWAQASLDAIPYMGLSEAEASEVVLTQRAEVDKTVRKVVESNLYQSPEQNNVEVVTSFNYLNVLKSDAKRLVAAKQDGRRACYTDRRNMIYAASSPAHEKMRACWEQAAAVLDPSSSVAWEVTCCGRSFMIPSGLAIWLAINYAHLADGLYADAAAYFLRASQAAAAGDAEQEQCWRTAANRLTKAADIVFDKLGIFVIYPEGHESDFTSLEPVSEVFNLPWTGWVRCGEILSLLRSAGNAGEDGAALSRALVSLMEEQERVQRSAEPSAASCLFRCENEVPLRKRVLVSIQEIFDGVASAAGKALGGGAGGRHLSPERIQQLCKIAVLAVTLCEKCREMWRRDSQFRLDQYPNHIERGAEWAAAGLTSVVAALRADDEEIVLQAYMEAAWQDEMAAAVLAEQPVSSAASSADS